MSFYVKRLRDKWSYVTGPFQTSKLAENYAHKWLEAIGDFEVVSSKALEHDDFDFKEVVDPYHAAQIEVQPSDPNRCSVHIGRRSFDIWMQYAN